MQATSRGMIGLTLMALFTGCARDAGDGAAFIELGNKKHTRWISAVTEKAGAKVWPTVTRLKFTVTQFEDGKVTSRAAHDWDVRGGKDTISDNGNTLVADLKASPTTAEQARAAALHDNDVFLLLFPMKLGDAGVITKYVGGGEFDGRSYDVLSLTTEPPSPQSPLVAKLFVDAQTVLVRAVEWTGTNAKNETYSCDAYQDFSGLLISTKRRSADDRRRVEFSDVYVGR